MKDSLRFDLTTGQKIPEQLVQQYLFMPAQVKMCYLAGVLRNLLDIGGDDDEEGGKRDKKNSKKKGKKGGYKGGKKGGFQDQDAEVEALLQKGRDADARGDSSMGIIIFVGTCRRCQEIAEVLLELGVDCVALHSMMNQPRRIAALGKFKSQLSKILVATDVASRGLDIPTVDLVINMDLPKVAVDYVHRIGRTARAGRHGRSLSLVTQYDVDLVHSIEEYTGSSLELSEEVKEEEIVPLLNPVAKAMRLAQLKLLEQGFEEQAEVFSNRKKTQADKLRKKKKSQMREEKKEKEKEKGSA